MSGIGYCPGCGFVLTYKSRCVKCGGKAVVLLSEEDCPDLFEDKATQRALKLVEWRSMLSVTP